MYNNSECVKCGNIIYDRITPCKICGHEYGEDLDISNVSEEILTMIGGLDV